MSVMHRNRTAPEESAATTPSQDVTRPLATVQPSATAPIRPAARTRTSAAWLGICLAAVVLVLLIVFMLQNTGSVEVSLLWMHGSVPLALALLIAAVGAAVLTMMVGVARITQLRHRFRQRH